MYNNNNKDAAEGDIFSKFLLLILVSCNQRNILYNTQSTQTKN